jgi:superfamily I DNA/RNA helicase
MQSLPTALTTAQLEGILSELARLPSAAVNRHPDIITVTATRKKTGDTVKVLSAATSNGQQWHVMTVPGLISATFTN